MKEAYANAVAKRLMQLPNIHFGVYQVIVADQRPIKISILPLSEKPKNVAVFPDAFKKKHDETTNDLAN